MIYFDNAATTPLSSVAIQKMTDLMRKDLQALFDDSRSAHAGLLIQRGLKTWDGDNEKPIKKNLIGKISGVAADNLYCSGIAN